MGQYSLRILALAGVTGLGLTACSGGSTNGREIRDVYVHSTDTHPCLDVTVASPDVIKVEAETRARVEVSNRCNEATTYESSGPPYALALIREDEIIWYTPSEPVPDILLEYTVEANGTTLYDVPVRLSADKVPPGNYRMIANLFVHPIDPDATQYEEPLRLESKPQTVTVEP
jgi:hypothetical protein